MAEYLLEAQHLRKAFEDKTVLQDVSLGVRRGEVVVIGPSGCGKSTLLRCLNGLESVDGGEILLEGQIISGQKKNLHLIRQRVGMVFKATICSRTWMCWAIWCWAPPVRSSGLPKR